MLRHQDRQSNTQLSTLSTGSKSSSATMMLTIMIICALFATSGYSSLATSHPKADDSTPIRILPLGDSITQGDVKHNTYRRQLWFLLLEAGYSVDFVGSLRTQYNGAEPPDPDFDQDHEGHYGWRADNILDGRYAEGGLADWLKGYTADVALIHLGTNDARFGDTPQDTIEEIRGIIELLRADNKMIDILVAQIIPKIDDPAHNIIIQEFNALVPLLATEMDTPKARVIAVDHYSNFNAEQDTFDGIHPNVSGETKMAQTWFLALTPLLNAKQPTPTATITLSPSATNTVATAMTATASSTATAIAPIIPSSTPTFVNTAEVTPTDSPAPTPISTLTPNLSDVQPKPLECTIFDVLQLLDLSLSDLQGCVFLPFIVAKDKLTR